MCMELYNNAPVMFFSLDQNSFNIINANLCVQTTLDFTLDDLKKINFLDLFTSDCRESIKEIISQEESTHKVHEQAVTMLTKSNMKCVQDDSCLKHVTMKVSTIRNPHDGAKMFTYVIVHDVTTTYENNAKVENLNRDLQEAKDRAELASLAKSQFLTTMSHEIRTPLHGILCASEILAQDSRLESDQLEYVDVMQQSGSLLMQLINNILDLSRIEADKLVLVDQTFSPKGCIEKVVKAMLVRANMKNLEFKINITDDLPELLIGDPDRLKQVLSNLIGNSIKFTEQGFIQIGISAVKSSDSGVLLEFYVQDDGIGIPQDMHDKLFKSFSQIHGGHFLNGTGLGLSICKSIVECMGGRIWVESRTNGSVFLFTAKFKPAVRKEVSHVRSNSAIDVLPTGQVVSKNKIRILVVEDNVINRAVLGKLLKNLGCDNVDMASNGLEALEACKKNEYDLCLMDCNMPVMGGVESTRHIRSFEKQSKKKVAMKIFALTANATVSEQENCLSAGMDGFYSKPLKIGALRDLISK
ncbi:hybrid signal transduction histidine kinase dhkK [Acrasis kona]|uniref:histidine kinase n=1 Tax=Acrasis kona TaxID=1008807 RepID=A0AAW2ZDL4_9EUKA